MFTSSLPLQSTKRCQTGSEVCRIPVALALTVLARFEEIIWKKQGFSNESRRSMRPGKIQFVADCDMAVGRFTFVS